jgi:hypothetical protein
MLGLYKRQSRAEAKRGRGEKQNQWGILGDRKPEERTGAEPIEKPRKQGNNRAGRKKKNQRKNPESRGPKTRGKQQGIKHRKKANIQGRNRQEKGRTMETKNEGKADNTGD